MHVATFDPEQAIVQSGGAAGLVRSDRTASAADGCQPILARSPCNWPSKKLPRLREAAQEQSRDDLKTLKKQLAHADKLHATEPGQARAMWEGIVVLYEKKSWAQEVVEQARKRLAMHGPRSRRPCGLGPSVAYVASQPDRNHR